MSEIDPVRLAAILDAGQAAQAHGAALGREADDIREAMRHVLGDSPNCPPSDIAN